MPILMQVAGGVRHATKKRPRTFVPDARTARKRGGPFRDPDQELLDDANQIGEAERVWRDNGLPRRE